MCRGGLRGSPAAIGGGALISSGTFMHAKCAASGRRLAVSVVRGGGAALRAGWKGDTSPPAGCCIGTYDSIWELLENSARYAESLSAQQLMSPVWELLDFKGRILWRHFERNPSAPK
jgi:hypothetical protein